MITVAADFLRIHPQPLGLNMIRRSLPIITMVVAATLTPQLARAQGGFRVPDADTMLPEVTVLDDQGQPFATKTLREHYSVLVFGCLT